MLQTAKWANTRWKDNNRRMLSSNQMNPKRRWHLVKEKQGITSPERVPAFTKPCGNLAITNQEKADLPAEVFSEKMRTPEPDRQPLATSSIVNVVITETAVRRHLKASTLGRLQVLRV